MLNNACLRRNLVLARSKSIISSCVIESERTAINKLTKTNENLLPLCEYRFQFNEIQLNINT